MTGGGIWKQGVWKLQNEKGLKYIQNETGDQRVYPTPFLRINCNSACWDSLAIGLAWILLLHKPCQLKMPMDRASPPFRQKIDGGPGASKDWHMQVLYQVIRNKQLFNDYKQLDYIGSWHRSCICKGYAICYIQLSSDYKLLCFGLLRMIIIGKNPYAIVMPKG